MEEIGAVDSATAIRCAKAVILLSSLRNSIDTKNEMEVEKLRRELVKERLKNRKFRRLASAVSLICQTAIIFCVCTLCLLLASQFF